MSPFSNHSLRRPSCGRLPVSALARKMPLMPPADVPVMMSTTTRILASLA